MTFDPSRLNDTVAMQTAWGPLQRGGANFRTHRLVTASPSRLEYRITFGGALFAYLLMFVGAAVACVFLYAGITQSESLFQSGTSLIPVVIGVVFVGFGVGLHRQISVPRAFDKRKGRFWWGPEDTARTAAEGCDLNDIHALQLLSEKLEGRNGHTYCSYELNLVLKDGRRLGVVDHGNGERLRDEAQILARFLGCAVWDASDR